MIAAARFLRRFPLPAALLVLLVTSPGGAMEATWHWEDRFSDSDKHRLTRWIMEAHRGVEALFGDLPYAIDVHFHRSRSSREPVPWANTDKRRGRRAVNFHVDTSHDWSDFHADWTASHELSHLVFPYLGRDGSWFAEGIASYLQYQVMYAAGNLSWDRAIARYRERFATASRMRNAGDRPIVELPSVVRQTRSYVRMYWGGAAFFLQADARLARERRMRLHEVIHRYAHCCFSWRDDAMDLIREFDRISDSRIFAELYDSTVSREGFPETSEALGWLAENPPPLID